MTVAEPEMPASARRRFFHASVDALILLNCGLLWVLCAGCIALAIARLTLGQIEVPRALWLASMVSVYVLMSLTPVAWLLASVRSSRSPYNNTNANKDPGLMGGLVTLAFMLLAIDYDWVVGLLGVEGCQRERIGLIVRDVALIGAGAACCFVTLPAIILRQWRMK